LIAQVAVSAAVYAIDKPYSYRIPREMSVRVGMRVTVPFGRSNRRSEAVVLSVSQDDAEGLKSIEQVMDDIPLLSEQEIRMAAFIRERYFCTFYDAIGAILPSGVWLAASTVYELTGKQINFEALEQSHNHAFALLQTIVSCNGRMDFSSIRKSEIIPEEELEDALHYLTKNGFLRSNLDISKKKRDKKEKIISLCVSSEEAMSFALRKRTSAPLQHAVLQTLSASGPVNSKELCYYTGANMGTLRRLEELGYITMQTNEIYRSPIPKNIPAAAPIHLNDEQQTAFDHLLDQSGLTDPGAALLYGVTGSGKTAVYIRLIQEMLTQDKSSILLVPEISLTPQLLSLLVSHFSDKVAVLHSGLRVTERYDEWKRIRSGAAKVVVGTRSAVFAPVDQLGLLIIDEEQEHTYKSENSPRYHAREIALYRGLKEHALVVLGSATPSVETMYKAKIGQYSLYRLSYRYNGKELPSTDLIDMKQEIRQGNDSSISTPLKNAMQRAFRDEKQCILFLNRRGAGRHMVCISCGEVPSCPRCSVNLTYHLANNRLMCHHCGYSEEADLYCPSCGNHRKIMGTGTQKVEQELNRIFPSKQVLRMDADVISASENHEVLLSRFQKEHIPILLGTQMITKGLNFDDVTVVGVLDADQALYSGNFRAAENAFSMVTQVVGRSGRGASAGTALIQTMTPEHSVLQLAAAQDYDQFYALEITMRQMLHTPPFSDLFQIHFVGSYDGPTHSAAARYRADLERTLHQPPYSSMEARIFGPAPAPVLKVNNTYRYRLTLSCTNQKPVRLLIAHLLREFVKNKENRGVSAFADVNPYD
jgi:primosomal protein N' (replication factor Y)